MTSFLSLRTKFPLLGRSLLLMVAMGSVGGVWGQRQPNDSLFGVPSAAPTFSQRSQVINVPALLNKTVTVSGATGSPVSIPSTSVALPVLPVDLTPEQRALASKYVSQYKMGSGDVITVRIFGEDDLSREKIRISDSGTIFVPALGELSVLGLKLGEIEKVVAEGLRGRILVNPQVSVFVDEYRPFFINGKVTRPGGYPYQPGLTVRKAAALAGGFMDRASLSKIFVIRSEDQQQASSKIDLNDLVFPGDIVTVEESFF